MKTHQTLNSLDSSRSFILGLAVLSLAVGFLTSSGAEAVFRNPIAAWSFEDAAHQKGTLFLQSKPEECAASGEQPSHNVTLVIGSDVRTGIACIEDPARPARASIYIPPTSFASFDSKNGFLYVGTEFIEFQHQLKLSDSMAFENGASSANSTNMKSCGPSASAALMLISGTPAVQRNFCLSPQ